VIVAMVFLSLAATTSAVEIETHGFLTGAIGIIDKSDILYAGYSNDATLDADSIIGIQLDAVLSDELSVITQIIAYGWDDYNAAIEWAFLRWQATESLLLRAGRLRAPLYMFSDYLEVGFAYPWIMPPAEVYGFAPITGMDAIDIFYRGDLFDIEYTVQTLYGRNDTKMDLVDLGETRFDAANMTGLILGAGNSYANFQCRYLIVNDFTFDIPDMEPLYAGLELAGYPQLIDDLKIYRDQGVFMGVGLNTDFMNIKLISEWTRLEFEEQFLPEKVDSWYVTLGYRLGKFMPHVTYARMDSTINDVETAIPSGADPMLDVIKGYIADIVRSNAYSYQTTTVGIRYDVAPMVALKLEWSQAEATDDDNPRINHVYYEDTGDTVFKEKRVNLYRFAFDVIF